MQHLRSLVAVCEAIKQHLHNPFAVCEMTTQHLHSLVAVCEATTQHLHSLVAVCERIMQHLHSVVAVCVTTMQHLRSVVAVCEMTTQHLRSPFVMCAPTRGQSFIPAGCLGGVCNTPLHGYNHLAPGIRQTSLPPQGPPLHGYQANFAAPAGAAPTCLLPPPQLLGIVNA